MSYQRGKILLVQRLHLIGVTLQPFLFAPTVIFLFAKLYKFLTNFTLINVGTLLIYVEELDSSNFTKSSKKFDHFT